MSSLSLVRTDSNHPDFIRLVHALNIYLAERDGALSTYYAQFNKIDKIKHVLVAFQGDEAVGCGSIKAFDARSMEVKRMYVTPEVRGQGIATTILAALEAWAKELGHTHSVLETGKKFKDAVGLYLARGYEIIPNYGPYIDVAESICFEKRL